MDSSWAAQSQPADRTTVSGAGGEEAQEPSLTGGAEPLRCLDASHPEDCPLCVAAPPFDTADKWQLCGDPGKKNGPAKVRQRICLTPEWASPATRVAAAAALKAEGLGNTVAAALKDRRVAQLHKAAIFALLRLWGYKSELWQPVSWQGAKRLRAEQASSEAEDAAGPPRRRRALAVPAVPAPAPLGLGTLWDILVGQLRPRSVQILASLAGSAARDALLVNPAELGPFATRLAQQLPAIEAQRERLAGAWLPQLRAVAAAVHSEHLAQVTTGGVAGPRAPFPQFVAVSLDGFRARVAAAGGPASAQPLAHTAEGVWAAETAAADALAADATAFVDAVLHALRAGPPETYTAGASMLADFLAAHGEERLPAHDARLGWARQLVAAPPPVEPPAEDGTWMRLAAALADLRTGQAG